MRVTELSLLCPWFPCQHCRNTVKSVNNAEGGCTHYQLITTVKWPVSGWGHSLTQSQPVIGTVLVRVSPWCM